MLLLLLLLFVVAFQRLCCCCVVLSEHWHVPSVAQPADCPATHGWRDSRLDCRVRKRKVILLLLHVLQDAPLKAKLLLLLLRLCWAVSSNVEQLIIWSAWHNIICTSCCCPCCCACSCCSCCLS
jgi:hypothetical protein